MLDKGQLMHFNPIMPSVYKMVKHMKNLAEIVERFLTWV